MVIPTLESKAYVRRTQTQTRLHKYCVQIIKHVQLAHTHTHRPKLVGWSSSSASPLAACQSEANPVNIPKYQQQQNNNNNKVNAIISIHAQVSYSSSSGNRNKIQKLDGISSSSSISRQQTTYTQRLSISLSLSVCVCLCVYVRDERTNKNLYNT